MGTMEASEANSLNRRCAGRSPGTLFPPEIQAYRSEKFRFLLEMQPEKTLRKGRKVLSRTFSFSHLAEQIPEGFARQYSFVHSGLQLSGPWGSITAQNNILTLNDNPKEVSFTRY